MNEWKMAQSRIFLILLEIGRNWISEQTTLSPIHEQAILRYLSAYHGRPNDWAEAVSVIRRLHESIGRTIRHTREDGTISFHPSTYRGASKLEALDRFSSGEAGVERMSEAE